MIMNYKLIEDLNVVQINLMRSWHELDDLIVSANNNRIDIALISEPPIHNGRLIKKRRFKIVQNVDANIDAPNKVAVLLFNPSLTIVKYRMIHTNVIAFDQ